VALADNARVVWKEILPEIGLKARRKFRWKTAAILTEYRIYDRMLDESATQFSCKLQIVDPGKSHVGLKYRNAFMQVISSSHFGDHLRK
jgi:hypothetical protein